MRRKLCGIILGFITLSQIFIAASQAASAPPKATNTNQPLTTSVIEPAAYTSELFMEFYLMDAALDALEQWSGIGGGGCCAGTAVAEAVAAGLGGNQ